MLPYKNLMSTPMSSEEHYNLGLCLQEGRGVEKHLPTAIHFFKLAARQGHVDAQFCLANIYFDENQNKKSFKFYKLAADQGHISAMNKVAMCYSRGLGVEENKNEVMKYTLLAAERGDREAQILVADYYLSGKFGFEKNMVKAIKYYKLASEQPVPAVNGALPRRLVTDPTAMVKIFLNINICEESSPNL